jgi:tRNA1(Val) A37 N6-methylase TrmN6
MQGTNGERMRFDFVVGNPPYIGLNECYKNNVPFATFMRDKNTDGAKNSDK